MAFAALYDTDVLIPHEIRDILMISASTRLHAVYWSDDIFEEWRRNAVGKNLVTQESVLRFQAIMNEMFPDGLIARYRYEKLIDSMTNHKKDRHVLAAAVIAEADVLVTKNVGDFPKESVERYNIEVQTPDQFVRHQAALNPALFLDGFLTRARDRNELSMARGKGSLTAEDIALFLRDGPSDMPATGQYILDLLAQIP
jgi:predicted nucleic acid-binding protein